MEGYWTMHYEMGGVQGDGIAMLHHGEFVGGDSGHIWSGSYEEDGRRVYARIRIVPSVSSPEEQIFARDQPIILSLFGYCAEDVARLEGGPEHQKGQRVEITMQKCKGTVAGQPFGKKAA